MPAPSPMAATCTRCGGTVALRLSGPLTCPFCKAVDALPPALLAQLEPVRRQLGERDQKLQQFLSQDGAFTRKFLRRLEGQAPLLAVLWVLGGAMFWGIAGTLLGEGRSLLDLVIGRVPAATQDEQLSWFFVYTGALFFAVTFLVPSSALSKARAVALSTRPFAPAAPGTPPRCRCCLAELPAEGAVRRCLWCGADHLALDDRYRAEQASLDRSIADALAEGKRSLAARQRKAEARLSWSLGILCLAFVPAIVVAPVLAVLLPPAGGLYVVPAAAAVAAVASYRRARSRVRAMQGPKAPAPAPTK